MREIKFRAWDWWRMLSDPKIWFLEWKYNYSINDELQSSDYIYMQYIWLKDKNWKEIYEGDIIKCNTNKWEYNNIIEFHKHYIRLRRWRYTYPISPYSGLINLRAEVIWNIYENPELLK